MFPNWGKTTAFLISASEENRIPNHLQHKTVVITSIPATGKVEKAAANLINSNLPPPLLRLLPPPTNSREEGGTVGNLTERLF